MIVIYLHLKLSAFGSIIFYPQNFAVFVSIVSTPANNPFCDKFGINSPKMTFDIAKLVRYNFGAADKYMPYFVW